jgi:hypothetical protein
MNENQVPQLGADGLIVEGIVTSQNADGTINVAPMGPLVDASFDTLILRPFQTSTTYENLARNRRGVFHVVDDVELIAKSAIGASGDLQFCDEKPLVLTGACRWYEFKVVSIDDAHDRASMIARTVDRGSLREFMGFNRAKHATVEAAILATRLHILPPVEVFDEFARLQIIVDKTGSTAELRAFELLRQHIAEQIANQSCAESSAS